jgi:hypothetical protein
MNMPAADKSRKSPEQHIQDALGLVHAASLNNQYLHLSQNYAYSPGQTAVVLCYVTCPDAMASAVRQAVDEVVQSVFAEHGLIIHKPQ